MHGIWPLDLSRSATVSMKLCSCSSKGLKPVNRETFSLSCSMLDMPLRVTITPGSEPTNVRAFAAGGDVGMALFQHGGDVAVHVRELPALDRFHDQGRDALAFQVFVQVLGAGRAGGAAPAAGHFLPVDIIELDLHEIPVIKVHQAGKVVTFAYSNFRISKNAITPNDKVTLSVDVTNTGDCSADEVVQIYVRTPDSPAALERPAKRTRPCRIRTVPATGGCGPSPHRPGPGRRNR